MNINKFVGSKIKEYRNKKGMSQKELGEKLGVKQNTVAGYEKGEWEVSYDNLFKLAELFEITIDDLFPATKTDKEYNVLHEASAVAETKELNYDDMLVLQKVTEKLQSLEGEKRKELMKNIKFAVDFFEKENQ